MRKLFLLIGLLFPIASLAVTPTIDLGEGFNGLDASGQAAVLSSLAAEQKKIAKAAEVQLATVEQVKPWVDLFDGVGDGVVKFAKDMGMTANELLNTPVGWITVGLIAYQVAGPDAVEFMGGLVAVSMWVAIMTPLLLLFLFKITIPVVETRKVMRRGRFGFGKPAEVDVGVRAAFNLSERRSDGGRQGPCLSFLLFLGVYVLGFIIVI